MGRSVWEECTASSNERYSGYGELNLAASTLDALCVRKLPVHSRSVPAVPFLIDLPGSALGVSLDSLISF